MLRSMSVLAALTIAACNSAIAADDFYLGKSIRLVVASDVGGGYDSYARTFAQHLRKHLPGEPSIIVQNMPGAGGMVATNWLYNVASKDGLTIGLSQRGVPFHPFFGERNAKFVPTEFNWIGSFNSDTSVTMTWHTSKVKTMADALRETAVMGGSGPNDSETHTSLMNNTIGTKFRVVGGYKSNVAVWLAMERGEVEGIAGSWASTKVGKPQWLRDKQVHLLVQVGKTKHPDLAHVPLLADLVKKDEDKMMWNVMAAMAEMGRPLLAPPGIPKEAVKLLRAGFAATMKDPAYVAEMETSKREITPVDGEAMQRLLEEVAAMPAPVLTKLNTYIKRN